MKTASGQGRGFHRFSPSLETTSYPEAAILPSFIVLLEGPDW